MAEAAVKTTDKQVTKAPPTAPAAWHPLDSLRREVDQLFEDFGLRSLRAPFGRSGVDLEPFWHGEIAFGKVPAVDFVDNEKAYVVTAELPGLSTHCYGQRCGPLDGSVPRDRVSDGSAVKAGQAVLGHGSDGLHGSFRRTFQVPHGVDAEKIEARFANGVLTVNLPKAPETVKNEKKIEIRKG